MVAQHAREPVARSARPPHIGHDHVLRCHGAVCVREVQSRGTRSDAERCQERVNRRCAFGLDAGAAGHFDTHLFGADMVGGMSSSWGVGAFDRGVGLEEQASYQSENGAVAGEGCCGTEKCFKSRWAEEGGGLERGECGAEDCVIHGSKHWARQDLLEIFEQCQFGSPL